jgi:hypothetical protein
MSVNPNFIPERSGVNSLGTRAEPWERANVEEIALGERVVPVDDIATYADTPANTPNLLPTPAPFEDNGRIVRAKNGMLVLVDYPKNAMPPTDGEDAGKVVRIGMDGVPRLVKCGVLPEVTPFDEGATLRVVGGELKVRRGNAHGELSPTPIAPQEDGYTIVSENGQWVVKSLANQYVMPPIGAGDVGKFVVLHREDESAPIEVRYVDPPLASGETIGAIPPIDGDANHYLNGRLEWKLITPGNGGHYRLGDIKPTIRPLEPPWLLCDGAGVGSQPSGAQHHDAVHRRLYALLDGTPAWEANWDNNVVRYLPSIAWCQICYLPDAQAPAPFAVLFEADYAANGNSYFELQFSTAKLTWPELAYNSSEHPGFWRLGGSLPSPTSYSGDAYPVDGETVMFDVSEVWSDFGPGVWYWRCRQRVGGTYGVTAPRPWQYGTVIVPGDAT